MKIAGVDIGTTGCKISVYEENGAFVCEAYEEYSMSRAGGRHELDPEAVWESVKKIILRAAPFSDGLKAIGLSSFGEAFVMLDENDRPLMNAPILTDSRGDEQCKRLADYFGREEIARITGINPHRMFSISRIMWVKENRPEVYEQSKRILCFQDYIAYMLSGSACIDYATATRTMAFDINTLSWSKEILDFAGIDEKKLALAVKPGTPAGKIKPSLAKELSLPEDLLIVAACHDQVAAAVGTGTLSPGEAVDGTGTVECITPVYRGIPKSARMRENNYAVIPYVVPGCYVTYAFSFTGGALLKWYRDNLVACEAKMIKESGKNVYEHFDSLIKDELSGLLVLPYFAGAATPYMDSGAKGAILGITLETTACDIYRGLMEGVTYEMLVNKEALEKAGVSITSLRATGGGAASDSWLQMKADVLGLRVSTLGAAQSGTLGCIMITGTACGIYGSLEEAANIFVKVGKTYYPREDMHKKYMEQYRRYKKMYPAVRSILED